MPIKGRWFITPHAVQRARERFPGWRALNYEDARDALIDLCRGARLTKVENHDGLEIQTYRTGKPLRAVMIVASPSRFGDSPTLLTVKR